MTNSGDRSARLGNSPARTSTVFVVAKDPETHFGDTRPAFAGHGAVLLEVESREFYEHLTELIAEEEPGLAAGLVAFSSVELKPAAMVRVRKELNRSQAIAANLGLEEFAATDETFRRIGTTCRTIKMHADDLRDVLPALLKSSDAHHECMVRHAQIVRECWRLLNDASGCYSTGAIYVPHPLTREIEALSLLVERSLPELAECDLFDAGKKAIAAVIDSITCVDPDGRDLMTEYMFSQLQLGEQFMARLALRFGDGLGCLTDADRDSLDSVRKRILLHIKRREREGRKSEAERRKGKPSISDLIDQVVGQSQPSQPAAAAEPQASASSRPKAHPRSKQPDEPSTGSSAFTIDMDLMTVYCGDRSVTLDGQRHRRLILLRLMLDRPGVPISHASLCGPGTPWKDNRAGKVSEGAIKSLVRELKKDLKPLEPLPVSIHTQTLDDELRPILKRK